MTSHSTKSFTAKSLVELAEDQRRDGQQLASWRETHDIPNAISVEIYRFMATRFPEFTPAGYGKDHRVFARENGEVVIKACYSLTNLPKNTLDLARHAFGSVADETLLEGPTFAEHSREFKVHRSPTVRAILADMSITIPEYHGYVPIQVSDELIFYPKAHQRMLTKSFPLAAEMAQFRAKVPTLSERGVLVDWGTPNNVLVCPSCTGGSHEAPKFCYVDSVQVTNRLWSMVDVETADSGELAPEVFDALVKR